MDKDMNISLNGGWMGNKDAFAFGYASFPIINEWTNAFTWVFQYPSGRMDAKVVPWESDDLGNCFYVGDKRYSA